MSIHPRLITDNLFCEVEAYELDQIHSALPRHFHTHYALGDEDVFLSRGDVILLNPGDRHSCSPLAGKALKFTGLNMSESFFEKIFQDHMQEDCRPLFSEKAVSDTGLAQCVRKIHAMVCERPMERRLPECADYLFQILFERCKGEARSGNAREKNAVSSMCHYMDSRYAEPISLAALSQISGLSKSTLTRCFERQMKISPYGYLTNVRIRQAKRFLACGLSPSDVAMRTGFADQSHFTNRFRQHTGLTPGEYRKIFRMRGHGDV